MQLFTRVTIKRFWFEPLGESAEYSVCWREALLIDCNSCEKIPATRFQWSRWKSPHLSFLLFCDIERSVVGSTSFSNFGPASGTHQYIITIEYSEEVWQHSSMGEIRASFYRIVMCSSHWHHSFCADRLLCRDWFLASNVGDCLHFMQQDTGYRRSINFAMTKR